MPDHTTPTPPPTEPREMTALTDVQLIDWLELHSGTRYKDAARRLRARCELAPQLERLAKERNEWESCAKRTDAKMLHEQADHNKTVDRLITANERLARLEEAMRTTEKGLLGEEEISDSFIEDILNDPENYDRGTVRDVGLVKQIRAALASCIMKERVNGETKFISLKDLRERIEAGKEYDKLEWGGCGCSIETLEEVTT